MEAQGNHTHKGCGGIAQILMKETMTTDGKYKIFFIPKHKGGYRQIEAPQGLFREELYTAYKDIRPHITYSPFCHAFARKRSIVTMALNHTAAKYVLRFDLKDFFPSIKRETFENEVIHMVRGGHRGWKDKWRTERSRLCDLFFYDFQDGKGVRLPQGSPSSPALSNMFLYRYDWHNAWVCHKKRVQYSRYADDIVLSGSDEKVLWRLFFILEKNLKDKYNILVNEKKIRMMDTSKRTLVCGLILDQGKLKTPGRFRRKLKTSNFIAGKEGVMTAQTRGLNSYQHMVDTPPAHFLSSLDVLDRIVFLRKI